MSTLATPIRDKAKLHDPACVKVVFDSVGRALYFSRSPIPHARTWDDSLLTAEPPHFHQHIGLYAYRRAALARFVALPPGLLEKREKLEQLRALEAGLRIDVALVDTVPLGVDTPAELERARSILAQKTR